MGQEPYGKMFLVHIFLSTRSGANAMLSSSDDISPPEVVPMQCYHQVMTLEQPNFGGWFS